MKRRVTGVAGLLLCGLMAAGCQSGPEAPPNDPAGTAKKPVKLTFLAYGADEEVKALQTSVDRFNADNPTISVTFDAVKDRDEVLDQLNGDNPPDIYLLSRRDLGDVVEAGLNQPIDELLDSRGVSFGDDYKRDAIGAFSTDTRLQCMPYGASPMVIYFNKNLIDWTAMRDADAPTPKSHNFWTFEQFTAAAEFAATRPGTKGVYVEPTLTGLAPFIYSGGGSLFDDPVAPTTLTLAEEDSLEPLAQVMDVLRNNQLTPTPRQLRKVSALERFKTGKLGMIAGYRSLVPELRSTPSLSFDVMPMPALENEHTIGDVSGLCISSSPKSVSAAADFVVHAISTESVSDVASAGYLVPANNEVAESDAFLQRDQLPAHAEVFNRSIRDIVTPPALGSWEQLNDALHDQLYELFYARVLEDLQTAAEAIDETSRTVLSPPSDEESTAPGDEPSDPPGDLEDETEIDPAG